MILFFFQRYLRIKDGGYKFVPVSAYSNDPWSINNGQDTTLRLLRRLFHIKSSLSALDSRVALGRQPGGRLRVGRDHYCGVQLQRKKLLHMNDPSTWHTESNNKEVRCYLRVSLYRTFFVTHTVHTYGSPACSHFKRTSSFIQHVEKETKNPYKMNALAQYTDISLARALSFSTSALEDRDVG